jgi:uracil-DNA glycosylase
MKVDLPRSWRDVIGRELERPYFAELSAFVDEERKNHVVFPPEDDVWNALRSTPFDAVRVVLLGQDPYIGAGQAHGLCFSVKPGEKPPRSLANLFKEALADVPGFEMPDHGCLQSWASQGVLLLNTILTVREGEAGSHRGKGWETFTDAVIKALSARKEPVVFALFGLHAQKKAKLLDAARHPIIQTAHPSPLSAKSFFGSRPFSQINAALRALAQPEIDWRLPPLQPEVDQVDQRP